MNKADVLNEIQTYTSPCPFSWEAFKIENNYAVSYGHCLYLQNGENNMCPNPVHPKYTVLLTRYEWVWRIGDQIELSLNFRMVKIYILHVYIYHSLKIQILDS